MAIIYEQDGLYGPFRIGWEDEDFGGIAGILGQDKTDGTGDAPKDRDDFEWWAANKACLEMTPTPSRDSKGFCWDEERDVKAALRIIKAALKQERPLPEWAKTALAQGWKAPKGWKA